MLHVGATLLPFTNESYVRLAARISTGFCKAGQSEVNRRIPLPYLLSGLCTVLALRHDRCEAAAVRDLLAALHLFF